MAVTDFDRTLAGLIELGIGPWFVLRGIEQSGCTAVSRAR